MKKYIEKESYINSHSIRKLNLERDKIFLSVVSIFFSLYYAFSFTFFSYTAKSVRDDVVRLHILANSDSKADQDVKLKVRDALLKKNTALLREGVTTENAREYFVLSKDELLNEAKKVLRENGFNYPVKITLKKEYFKTREYGELTFPAGEYTALRVVLGKGEGHNWWCVMFPPLCVPAASDVELDEEKTAHYLTTEGDKLVKGGEKYKIKFKLLEICEKLAESIK